MTDPRAALAEATAGYKVLGPLTAEIAIQRLAERGVLLVTEERLAAAIGRCMREAFDTDIGAGFGLQHEDEQAAAIFAALSGGESGDSREVTE